MFWNPIFSEEQNMWQQWYTRLSKKARLCLFPAEFTQGPAKIWCILEGFQTRTKCEIWIIIWVMDHSNEGTLACVYAN